MLRTSNGRSDLCSNRIGGASILAYTPPANQKPNRWISNHWLAAGSSVPQGFNSERAITMPLVSGGNISCTMTGSADLVAGLGAIGNMAATLTGDSDFTANANVAANMVCTMIGEGDMVANLSAIGNMTATLDAGERPSAFDIAQEIWNSQKTSYNSAGTMGNALNNASSGGVDYNALAAAVWQYVIESGRSAEECMRIYGAVLAGKVSGAGTGTELFTGLDGTTVRVTTTVDNDGNRTAVVVNGT